MYDLGRHVASIKQAIKAKQAPLKVAQTRLELLYAYKRRAFYVLWVFMYQLSMVGRRSYYSRYTVDKNIALI